MKYAGDLVLLDTEEAILQGMIDKLKLYDAMEWKLMWKKNKLIRISMQPSPMQIMIDQKQAENVEYLTYLGSILTNDARCTGEMKSRTTMAKVAITNKKTFSPTNWTWN